MGTLVRPKPAVVLQPSNPQQTIDGFGASDQFLDTPLTDAQADLFFDPTLGIGLSLLRTGIDTDGTAEATYLTAPKAAARGAKIWATPWTAPAAMKDNGSLVNGGHLLPAQYDAWATILAGAQANWQAQVGVNFYALSVQNEPDYTASYRSMLYTTTEMANFIKVLGPKLVALTPVPLLMMPELSNWNSSSGYTAAVAADSTAQSYLGIVGNHQYSGVAAPASTFRPIWETEMSSFEAFDGSIANGLTVAQWIHDALTTGNVSAWHYWWLHTNNADNEGLIGTSAGDFTLTKRLYVLGNWSKFVRPGYVRVATTGTVPSGLSLTAFRDPASRGCVVVIVNTNTTETSFYLDLGGLAPTTMTPWLTANHADLASQAPIPIRAGLLPVNVEPQSVTSFVGTGT